MEMVGVMRKNKQVPWEGETEEGAETGMHYTRNHVKKGISQEGISQLWQMLLTDLK